MSFSWNGKRIWKGDAYLTIMWQDRTGNWCLINRCLCQRACVWESKMDKVWTCCRADESESETRNAPLICWCRRPCWFLWRRASRTSLCSHSPDLHMSLAVSDEKTTRRDSLNSFSTISGVNPSDQSNPYPVIVRSLEDYSDGSFSIDVSWGESVVNTGYSFHMFSILRPRRESLDREIQLCNRCYLHIFVGDDRSMRTAVDVFSSRDFVELWATVSRFRSAHNWNRPSRNRNRHVVSS